MSNTSRGRVKVYNPGGELEARALTCPIATLQKVRCILGGVDAKYNVTMSAQSITFDGCKSTVAQRIVPMVDIHTLALCGSKHTVDVALPLMNRIDWTSSKLIVARFPINAQMSAVDIADGEIMHKFFPTLDGTLQKKVAFKLFARLVGILHAYAAAKSKGFLPVTTGLSNNLNSYMHLTTDYIDTSAWYAVPYDEHSNNDRQLCVAKELTKMGGRLFVRETDMLFVAIAAKGTVKENSAVYIDYKEIRCVLMEYDGFSFAVEMTAGERIVFTLLVNAYHQDLIWRSLQSFFKDRKLPMYMADEPSTTTVEEISEFEQKLPMPGFQGRPRWAVGVPEDTSDASDTSISSTLDATLALLEMSHVDRGDDDTPMDTGEQGAITTEAPSQASAVDPTEEGTVAPSEESTVAPSEESAVDPSEESTVAPSEESTVAPSEESAAEPSVTRVVAELVESTVNDVTTTDEPDDSTADFMNEAVDFMNEQDSGLSGDEFNALDELAGNHHGNVMTTTMEAELHGDGTIVDEPVSTSTPKVIANVVRQAPFGSQPPAAQEVTTSDNIDVVDDSMDTSDGPDQIDVWTDHTPFKGCPSTKGFMNQIAIIQMIAAGREEHINMVGSYGVRGVVYPPSPPPGLSPVTIYGHVRGHDEMEACKEYLAWMSQNHVNAFKSIQLEGQKKAKVKEHAEARRRPESVSGDAPMDVTRTITVDHVFIPFIIGVADGDQLALALMSKYNVAIQGPFKHGTVPNEIRLAGTEDNMDKCEEDIMRKVATFKKYKTTRLDLEMATARALLGDTPDANAKAATKYGFFFILVTDSEAWSMGSKRNSARHVRDLYLARDAMEKKLAEKSAKAAKTAKKAELTALKKQSAGTSSKGKSKKAEPDATGPSTRGKRRQVVIGDDTSEEEDNTEHDTPPMEQLSIVEAGTVVEKKKPYSKEEAIKKKRNVRTARLAEERAKKRIFPDLDPTPITVNPREMQHHEMVPLIEGLVYQINGVKQAKREEHEPARQTKRMKIRAVPLKHFKMPVDNTTPVSDRPPTRQEIHDGNMLVLVVEVLDKWVRKGWDIKDMWETVKPRMKLRMYRECAKHVLKNYRWSSKKVKDHCRVFYNRRRRLATITDDERTAWYKQQKKSVAKKKTAEEAEAHDRAVAAGFDDDGEQFESGGEETDVEEDDGGEDDGGKFESGGEDDDAGDATGEGEGDQSADSENVSDRADSANSIDVNDSIAVAAGEVDEPPTVLPDGHADGSAYESESEDDGEDEELHPDDN